MDNKSTPFVFRRSGQIFWSVILAWCITWPLGSIVNQPALTAVICFVGWPAVAIFMIRSFK